MDNLVDSLKSYSEFDIIDGSTMKNFLAENLVMNYSNIEIHKILFQQMMVAGANKSNRRDNQNHASSLNRLNDGDDNRNGDGQQS